MQLLVAYEADMKELAVHSHALEAFAYAIFLELDEAIERLLQHCCNLSIDIDQTLSQGAPFARRSTGCLLDWPFVLECLSLPLSPQCVLRYFSRR